MPPMIPIQTDNIFAAFAGVFQVKYPSSVCVIFLITPRTEKDVGVEADKKKYVVMLTPTPATPLNIVITQNKRGALNEFLNALKNTLFADSPMIIKKGI